MPINLKFSLSFEDSQFLRALKRTNKGVEDMAKNISLLKNLVVIDLRMPTKHGHSLAVDLLGKENPPLIVIHTSCDDPRMTKDLMLRGVDDIVYKPANYPAFAAKLRGMAERRNSQFI